ncbi:MAG TPA: carbohydrate-binding domain-containing protein [Oscillospiraceae bacterium]|nr:carbohydrate-binding domain-containing protein [Oscillospiraceae bacterium]HPF55974.1 carbohydrate-binding domain-containing protein [Clostridiales bacterium]HPK34442.1 carbohydrate-binding domain-containing protein [Oscillospiraceae bacterium]HPR75573.1 carbohydrate-binding domain-containing protein [Oscillospiraceae bacterium]
MKKIYAILCTAMVLLFAAGCAGSTSTITSSASSTAIFSTNSFPASSTATSETASVADVSEEIKAAVSSVENKVKSEDTTVAEPSDGNEIVLNGSSISASGSNVSVSGSTATITGAGTYTISGTLDDGQIIVNAGTDDLVTLILNGVDISCSYSSGIYGEQSDKIIITLAAGTQNTISDGSSYTLEADTDEPNAALFSKDDLTLNGTGTLTVNGNYLNGILSKDDLVIAGGTYVITAVNDALRGRDSITITDGTFTINAGADGLQANNDEDAEKGYINISGGDFDITSGNDGIQAYTTLLISGGTFDITTGGGSSNASSGGSNDYFNPRGTTGSTSTSTTESMKGLKGGSAIYITGGTFTLDTSDDALHSNGDIKIAGGTFTIATGDDGMHADTALEIDAGEIKITKSYEGLEGMTIYICGGNISVTSSDDGLNSAGGSDDTGNVFFGGGGMDGANSDNCITIGGGYIYVNAGGDGLDSNGSMVLTGGTILVDGPTDSGNGAMDYNGTCTNSGAILIAAGSSGMAQAPDSNSSVNCIMATVSTVSGGTQVTVTDKSGNVIVEYTPSKSFSSIVISAPQLVTGTTYTLNIGGSSAGSFTAGGLSTIGSAGGMGGMTGGGRR